MTIAHAKQLANEVNVADDFVEKADMQGLRNLLHVAHQRETKIVSMIDTLCEMYADKPVQRQLVDENSIAAMREVALSTIQLAQSVLASKS